MAYKYTGRANTFTFRDKTYAKPELYQKNPKAYDGSYDNPIAGMTREIAESMAAQSRLHSFEDTRDGSDVLEKATAPNPNPAAGQNK